MGIDTSGARHFRKVMIMLYSEKYPNMKPIVDEEDGIMRGHKISKCVVCGKPTQYIDIDFEVYVCSEECSKVYWDAYMNEIQELG